MAEDQVWCELVVKYHAVEKRGPRRYGEEISEQRYSEKVRGINRD